MMAITPTKIRTRKTFGAFMAAIHAIASRPEGEKSTTPAKDAGLAILSNEVVPFDFGATVNKGRKAQRRRLCARYAKANSGRQWVRLRKALRRQAKGAT